MTAPEICDAAGRGEKPEGLDAAEGPNLFDGMSMYQIHCGDVLDELRKLPSASVDLVLTDPPYNIGVTQQHNGKKKALEWDRRADYHEWCMEWLAECCRVLKDNGVLYFWHNDIEQIAALLVSIAAELPLSLRSFCIWDKGETFRAKSWHNRDLQGSTAPRSWFNRCEYCLHFFKAGSKRDTGLERIYSSPECFAPLKDWYASELCRLGITAEDIKAKYTEATGKKPYMLRHYFQNSQFEIPTERVYNSVYAALGFNKSYEQLRQEYEQLRPYHLCDAMHSNVWQRKPIKSNGRMHTCQKPVDILARIIRVSCRPGGTVLDCFMGSGSTGEAAIIEGRQFIGIENDPQTFEIAEERLHVAEYLKEAEQ